MIPSKVMSDQVAQEIKVQEWIRTIKGVLIGVVVVGAAGLGYWGLQNASNAKSEKAFALLFKAEQIEQEAVKASEKSGDASSPEAQALSLGYVFEAAKKWTPEQQKEYISRLTTVTQTYPTTLASALALLRQGNLYFHLGQFAEAQKAFEDCVKNFKTTGENIVFKAIAFDGLASVLEAQAQWDGALKAHKDASEIVGNPLKPMSLLGMARVYRAQGKMDQAKPLFEQIIKDFPNSDYEKRARALISLPREA
jgi:tetratricopeptide (TPR) repeat protein